MQQSQKDIALFCLLLSPFQGEKTQTLTLDVPRPKRLELQSWSTSSMASSSLSYNRNFENGKFTVTQCLHCALSTSGAVGLLLSLRMNVGGHYGHGPTGLLRRHTMSVWCRLGDGETHTVITNSWLTGGLIQAAKRSVFQSRIQLQLHTGNRDTTAFSFFHIDNVV